MVKQSVSRASTDTWYRPDEASVLAVGDHREETLTKHQQEHSTICLSKILGRFHNLGISTKISIKHL